MGYNILPQSILDRIKVFAEKRNDRNTDVEELDSRYDEICQDIANRIVDMKMNLYLDGKITIKSMDMLRLDSLVIASNTVDTFADLIGNPLTFDPKRMQKLMATGGLEC